MMLVALPKGWRSIGPLYRHIALDVAAKRVASGVRALPMLAFPITQKATAPPGATGEAVDFLALRTKGNSVNGRLLHHHDSQINRRPHQAATALRPPRYSAMVGMTDARPPAGFLRDFAFERNVVKLHHLGPRAIAELLRDVGAQTMRMTSIEARVADFADLDSGVVRALGGDRFARPPLTVVPVADDEARS